MHEADSAAVIVSSGMLRWIVLLPLIGAAVNGLAGALLQKRVGRRAIDIIGGGLVAASFALAVGVFLELHDMEPGPRMLLDRLFPWVSLGALRVEFAFAADPLSAVMILVVTGVGLLIHVYSIGYMREDPAYWRYFAYLNLFTGAMLILVLADNLLLMFVGWEGVGLCSWALIGFWYRDWEKASAGSKAFIVNRIGDFGFLLGMLMLFWAMAAHGHPTLTFRELAAHAPLLGGDTALFGMSTVTAITLLLFVGATGKSAQIPLHVWLPDAMAGPTPVSALIHAATMVTAGVYMIGRLGFLYSMSPTTLTVVATVGALTALLAATVAATQHDIKKVLAYSTVSQLGYMFLAMGSGAYAAGIFHLFTHAFFKACLFLCAGSVIHALHHEQDMRRMGGLRRQMPITYATFVLSTLAIVGLPPTSGFFSKDEILWKAFDEGHFVLWVLAMAAAGLTAFYMFRQVFLTFHGESRVDHHVREHLRESPRVMTLPLMMLAGCAVVVGFLNVPVAFFGAARFERWLEPVFGAHVAHAAPAHGSGALEALLALLAVATAVVGVWLAWRIYERRDLSPERFTTLWGGRPYRWAVERYRVDELYEAVFVNGTLRLSRGMRRFDDTVIDGLVNLSATVVRLLSRLGGAFDRGVVDGAVNGVATLAGLLGREARRLQTGGINAYLYVIVVAAVGVMIVRLL